MVIEWQRLQVRSDVLDRFLEHDAEIWTEALAREPGFVGKEIWVDEEEQEVILVIRWRSEEEWTGIPEDRLAEVEQRFRGALPEGYDILETRKYRALPTAPHHRSHPSHKSRRKQG